MNLTSRVSIPSSKSPKGVFGFHFPGYESYPENDSSIKMLEVAMQRLTNLCSVLNDMEPICVLNHVFVLKELDKMQGEQQSKGCKSLELAFCILWGGNCDGSICYSRFCYKTFAIERFLPC
ncbi:Protein NAP1 [Camellia lanceoleosa]|uniref:Protein NAP1 n=1 Tax=Camellia lanceoleosa TaxID=1840588 RepID=A0ACC0GUP8_9ERIC|nr:Protein NAP1 [Camellia lanceoleosa]